MDEQQKINAQKKGKVTVGSWYFSATQYLYARSFYLDKPVEKTLLSFVKSQVAADWTKQVIAGAGTVGHGTPSIWRYKNGPGYYQIHAGTVAAIRRIGHVLAR